MWPMALPAGAGSGMSIFICLPLLVMAGLSGTMPLLQPSCAACPAPGETMKNGQMSTYRSEEISRRQHLLVTRPEPLEILGGSLSLLETKRLKEGPARDYMNRINAFMTWCRARRLDWDTPFALDLIVIILFDEMFFKGIAVAEGSKLLACLAHFLATVPGYSGMEFPRARKALSSWNRISPKAVSDRRADRTPSELQLQDLEIGFAAASQVRFLIIR